MEPTFFQISSIMPLGHGESYKIFFSIQKAQVISPKGPISVIFLALFKDFILCYAVQSILCYAVRPFSCGLASPIVCRSQSLAEKATQGMPGKFGCIWLTDRQPEGELECQNILCYAGQKIFCVMQARSKSAPSIAVIHAKPMVKPWTCVAEPLP